LGLKAQLRALSGNMAFMAYQDFASGATLTRFSMEPLVRQVGEYPSPVARAELQAMLIDNYGRERVSFGKRVAQVEQHEHGVTALFEDGTTAQGDLLIA
ncbi:MAG TPA: monooxygenase, partial [Pantoea sp.]|nr:monooxygenase [Pantoea sp.]